MEASASTKTLAGIQKMRSRSSKSLGLGTKALKHGGTHLARSGRLV